MSTHPLALPALFLASFIGSFGGIAIKLALRDFGPFTLLFLRCLIAALVLLPVALPRFRLTRNFIKQSLLLSFFFVGNVALYVIGIQRTTVIVTGFLYSLAPVAIAVLTHLRRHQERVTLYHWLGFILSIFGILVILSRSSSHPLEAFYSVGTPLGNLIILAAVASYALYLYLAQPLTRRHSPITLTTVNFTLATFISFPLFWLELSRNQAVLRITLTGISSLLFIALLLSVSMYFLYQWGIKHTSSLTAGSTTYISPLITALAAIPILGERLTSHLVFGGAAILAGVYLANRKPRV